MLFIPEITLFSDYDELNKLKLIIINYMPIYFNNYMSSFMSRIFYFIFSLFINLKLIAKNENSRCFGKKIRFSKLSEYY